MSDGKVYTLGTYLKLHCLDAADGRVVWSKDLIAEFDGQKNTPGIGKWGNAASPIVEGNLVIVGGGGAGQSMMAFDKKTGEVVWKNHDEKITHATPTPATIHGVRQVVFLMQSGLVSVEPGSGNVLWKYAFPFRTSTAASPIVAGDVVYCSAGYDVGAAAVRVSKAGNSFEAKEMWRTPRDNMNHWSTPVHHEGYLYGIYGHKVMRNGPLACLDLKTGKQVWSQEGFGQGGTILVDGHILTQGDQGQIVLAEATPKGYREKARVHPIGGKAWNMAVVSGGKIFARSDREVICLDVSGK